MSADNAKHLPASEALRRDSSAQTNANPASASSGKSFRSMFCEHFNCPPEEYEKRAFSKLLFAHARFFAPFARTVFPQFFDEDRKFIEYLGHCAGNRDLGIELQEFKDVNRTRGGAIRTNFYIRVSGRKAKRLFRELRDQGRATATPLASPATSH